MTQRPVQIHAVGLIKRDGQTLGDDHLHHIPSQDVFLDFLHRRLECRLPKAGDELTLIQLLAQGRILRHSQRLAQTVRQRIQPCLRRLKTARLARVGMHDQVHLAGKVVKDHHLFRAHQQNVWCAQRVISRCAVSQPWLNQAHRVITKISHQTAMETGQIRHLGYTNLAAVGLDPCQRIINHFLQHHLLIPPQTHLVPAHLDALTAGQTDNGVTPPLLTALNRLQQIGPRSIYQLMPHTQRRVEVGQQRAHQRHTVIFTQGVKIGGVHGAIILLWPSDTWAVPPWNR